MSSPDLTSHVTFSGIGRQQAVYRVACDSMSTNCKRFHKYIHSGFLTRVSDNPGSLSLSWRISDEGSVVRGSPEADLPHFSVAFR